MEKKKHLVINNCKTCVFFEKVYIDEHSNKFKWYCNDRNKYLGTFDHNTIHEDCELDDYDKAQMPIAPWGKANE